MNDNNCNQNNGSLESTDQDELDHEFQISKFINMSGVNIEQELSIPELLSESIKSLDEIKYKFDEDLKNSDHLFDDKSLASIN